jgi:hypothetical protein
MLIYLYGGGFLMENVNLDIVEEKDLERLTNLYGKFVKPSLVNKTITGAKDTIYKFTPKVLKDLTKDSLDVISDTDLWRKVMQMAADGFMILQGVSSKYTISEKDIIKRIQKTHPEIYSINQIKNMKGYEIEKIVNSLDMSAYLSTILQSAPTGAVGMAGLPANIILSIFIQYRTVQLIAMYYGYDIKNSPSEMEYASAVLIEVISKGKVNDTGGLNEIIGKMMAEAELTSLRSALTKSNIGYAQMVMNGGIQQLYVKIRAITNKAALEALNKSNTKGIENGLVKRILESLSTKMSQSAGAKAVPVISAVLSVLIDTYQINKVLKMANIIYHKRFLIDKEISYKNTSFDYDVEVSE